MTALSTVPDPRDPRGVCYPMAAVLTVAVCAVLTGARSFAAIGEFAAHLGGDQLRRLRLVDAPVESTMRKLFARLDTAALDAALAVFAWSRVRQIAGRRVIAIDAQDRARSSHQHEHRATPDRRVGPHHRGRTRPARGGREVQRDPRRARPPGWLRAS